MNGLELSRAYFEACGRAVLEEQFSSLLPFLAVGLFGSGSECFGYDDELSRDHDFEPGFCIFLPGEDLVDRRNEFLLERAYAKLPRSFAGLRRAVLQPVGGPRRGVLRTAEFFGRLVGSTDGDLTTEQWLRLPEQALAEATNGELFFDNRGEVTHIREALRYFPEDIRLKRLAGHLLLMAQAGQYNYARCLGHGETAAAQLAAVDFVQSALSVLFLLNRRFRPFYKWTFRALRGLDRHAELAAPLETLISTGNEPDDAREKNALIEAVAVAVIADLQRQDLTDADGRDLERHAYAVNGRIRDAALRNEHILVAV